MEAKWIENIGEFNSIKQEWDEALLNSGIDNPFLLHDFISTWWKHFSKGRKLRIFVVYEGNKIVGGLPLYLERGKNRNIPIRTLHYPGDSAANYTEILLNQDNGKVIPLLIDSLKARKDWDVLELDRIRESCKLVNVYKNCEINRDIRLCSAQFPETYYIDINEEIANYIYQLPKKLRYTIRQGIKLADQLGGLELKSINDQVEIEKLFCKYAQFSVEAFRTRKKVSAFESKNRIAFFKDLLVRLSKHGYLDAHALLVGSEIVAIHFGYRTGTTMHYVLTTMDIRKRELSSGHLLIMELIKKAKVNGDILFDMHYGKDSLYKRQWSNRKESLYRLELLNGTIAAKLYAIDHYSKIVQKIKSKVKQILIKT